MYCWFSAEVNPKSNLSKVAVPKEVEESLLTVSLMEDLV